MKSGIEPLLGRIHALWYDTVMPRYYDLQPREQRLVVVASLVLPLIVLLFGVLLPAQDRRLAEELRLASLQQQRIEASQLADQLEQTAAVPVSTNVLAEVESLARKYAVRRFMTRIKPQTDLSGQQKLLLQMKQAPFDDVVRFIKGVTGKGLVIAQVKLQKTPTPAMVNVRMVLAQ